MLHPDLRQRAGAEPVVSVDVVQAKTLLRQLVVGVDEPSLRVDEAIFERMIEQRQRRGLHLGIVHVARPTPEQMRAADRVGCPARPLQIAKSCQCMISPSGLTKLDLARRWPLKGSRQLNAKCATRGH